MNIEAGKDDSEIEIKVEELLEKMTINDKDDEEVNEPVVEEVMTSKVVDKNVQQIGKRDRFGNRLNESDS